MLLLPSGAQDAHATSAEQDIDGDGIPDLQEDANGNGIEDSGETDPYNADTDRGGESDGTEIRSGRNPLDKTDDFTADSDSDGWQNGIEMLRGTDPKNPDSDSDGTIDSKDPFPLDAKYSVDADQNGLPDVWEQETTLNQQIIPQSKVDDPDGDGVTNIQELSRGTNPTESDTDRDGIDDKTEQDDGTNPRENSCLLYEEDKTLFDDMKNHWAESVVTLLKNTRILPQNKRLIQGITQMMSEQSHTVFLPDVAITRFEFLKMILMSTCTHFIATTELEHPFIDIQNSHGHEEDDDSALRRHVIYTAKHYDIVKGYFDGSFRPNDSVNRAEAVKMLLLGAQILPVVSTGAHLSFTDVQPSDWFFPYVQTSAEREIIKGYKDGTFRPNLPITRAEAAKIIEGTMRQNPYINGYVLP